MPNEIKPIASADNGVTMNQAFKLVVVVAALLALLYVTILLSNKSQQRAVTVQQNTSQELPKAIVKESIDEQILPSLFPQDIPIEAGAEVVENSRVFAEGGMKQATRTFESKKTMTNNYNLYLSYLQNNDWVVVNQKNDTEQKLLRGKKGYQTLLITMDPNLSKETTTVILTITEN